MHSAGLGACLVMPRFFQIVTVTLEGVNLDEFDRFSRLSCDSAGVMFTNKSAWFQIIDCVSAGFFLLRVFVAWGICSSNAAMSTEVGGGDIFCDGGAGGYAGCLMGLRTVLLQ